ncbi:MAG: ParA family protein [Chloroflexi bacterium]|nr:MAG: ParA family protein [Chloroflexota bacterium]
MSKRIGVLNYKGGTGKTTTVVSLGAGLAARGMRVLCIDLDAQGSLATYLGVNYTYSLAHVLLGQAEPQTCIVQARDNLDLIPSDNDLLQAEGNMWRSQSNSIVRQALTDKLHRFDQEYDYILVDFSPSASLLSESGLRYVRELVVPVSMSYLAMVGVRQVIQRLKDISPIPKNRARLHMILPTIFSARVQQDREVFGILRRHFGNKVADPIRKSMKLMEAPSHHKTIYEYSPRSNAASDYKLLVERILHNG